MDMKLARIDFFDSSFRFIYSLRENLLRYAPRYGFRSIPSDFNNRIDVQPIPNWRDRLAPHSIGADRKLYLTSAFTLIDKAEGEIILDFAIKVRSANLAVMGYYQKGSTRIDLISDTTFISEGRESTIATQVLDHLRTAWRARA